MPDLDVSVGGYTQTFAAIRDHLNRRTLVDELPRVTLPVTFILGRQSPIPPVHDQRTAALILGAVVHTLDPCGHMVWMEQPGATVEILTTMALPRRDALDSGSQATHDRAVESPSLMATALRLPGTLLRLPGATLRALDALITLADRIDRLLTLLERIEGALARAGSGVDLATAGINQALSGLERAVGVLDGSMPTLSDSASSLWTLTERLSAVAVDLATELPKATATLQDISPELTNVVGALDERFSRLDGVVTELANVVEGVVGTIPGMRRILRTNTET
jgi:hypothetical protein